MTLKELLENRAKLHKEMTNFLTEKEVDGMLSASDAEVYDKMEKDFDSLTDSINRKERIEKNEKALEGAINRMPMAKPEKIADEKTGRASDTYKANFLNMLRSGASSYEIRNALEEGTDSEGGYLVPDEFEYQLIQGLEEQNFVRRYATVIQTMNGDHKIPVVSQHGTASWVDEEGAYQESDEVFGQVVLGAHKVCTTIKVSEELLQDSAFNLEQYFVSEFARRIGNAEESKFMAGNGSGCPTGILASSGGAGTGVTASATDKITADEIVDLYYSLGVPYRKNAIFVMKDEAVKALRKLKDGNGRYLWQPALAQGQMDTLLGIPLITSPYMESIAAGKKSILIGDFSYYWIADRQARSFKRLNELYAANGQVGFMASQRVDGKCVLTDAFKVLVQAAS